MSEKVIVVSKNKMYSGVWPTEFGGVQFQKGKAECTEKQAKVLTDRPEFSIKKESGKRKLEDGKEAESGDGKPETGKDEEMDVDELFAEDPGQLDTEQLYEMAKSLDIEGRSKMKKKALIKAIQKAKDDDNNEDDKEGDE